MMRHARLALILAAAVALPSAAQAGQASTVRIETRPFYGATVTLEEGVRVFRALPADQRVIINPGGRTPLSLGIDESTSHNYYYDRTSARDVGADGSGAASGYYGSASARGRHKARGHGVVHGHAGAHGHGGGHAAPAAGRGH